jgi:hypothetical protein
VYVQFHKQADQHRSLDNLEQTIGNEPNLGLRETALNLLGHCMEQENRRKEAFYGYIF